MCVSVCVFVRARALYLNLGDSFETYARKELHTTVYKLIWTHLVIPNDRPTAKYIDGNVYPLL